MHAACCGTNTWKATQGSLTVFINGKAAHRMGDQNRHCGGMGQLVEGSPNVIVGESGGGSGGAGNRAGGSRTGDGNGAAGAGDHNGAGGNRGAGGDSRDDHRGPGRTSGSTATHPGSDDHRVEPDMIEVRLLDAADAPVSRAVSYELTLPDGKKLTGQTDANGILKLSSLTQRGNCTLVLPDFEGTARPAG
jgi:hypothetical protein